jgi:hypothetical protein
MEKIKCKVVGCPVIFEGKRYNIGTFLSVPVDVFEKSEYLEGIPEVPKVAANEIKDDEKEAESNEKDSKSEPNKTTTRRKRSSNK